MAAEYHTATTVGATQNQRTSRRQMAGRWLAETSWPLSTLFWAARGTPASCVTRCAPMTAFPAGQVDALLGRLWHAGQLRDAMRPHDGLPARPSCVCDAHP